MPEENTPAPSKWRRLLAVLKTIAIAILVFLLVSVLFTAAVAGTYYALNRRAFHSPACRVAVDYALHDKTVAKALGPVQDCRLPWLADYSTEETLEGGQAHFVLHAVGAKAGGTVDVSLEKLKHLWTVVQCQVTQDPEPLKAAAPVAKPAAKAKALKPRAKAAKP